MANFELVCNSIQRVITVIKSVDDVVVTIIRSCSLDHSSFEKLKSKSGNEVFEILLTGDYYLLW